LLDELCCGGVGVAGGVELDREISAIKGRFRDVERPFQVDVELFAVVVDFTVFDVGDAVGTFEHQLDRAVVKIGVAGEGGVCKIGQSAQVRIVDGVDDLDDEKGLFADGIVVLQGNHDIFPGGIIGYFPKAFRGALYIRCGIGRHRDMRTNAWGAHLYGHVYPLFCDGDRLLTRGGIRVVETGLHVGGNIHDVHIFFLQCCAELGQISGIGRAEVLCERLDVVDAKLGDNFGRELGKVHPGKAGVAIAIVRDVHVGAEWVGGYGDAIAWLGGELHVWGGLSRSESARGVSGEKAAGGDGGESFKEDASSQKVHSGGRNGVGDCTRTVADSHLEETGYVASGTNEREIGVGVPYEYFGQSGASVGPALFVVGRGSNCGYSSRRRFWGESLPPWFMRSFGSRTRPFALAEWRR
jgi:hypothetical protein